MSPISMPRDLESEGFAFVPADEMRPELEQVGALTDWAAFSDSWNNLETDTFMSDKGRYRKRRYGVYTIAVDGTLTREPHQPHFQTTDYNPVNGGIDRWFEPILPEIGSGESLTTILRYCHRLFSGLSSEARTWHVETHQFRIEAHPDQIGQPTPEGMHRDGVDYVLVLMIRRENIASGITSIHDPKHRQLGSFTLTKPFDAAMVDDKKVFHGVTSVTPLDPDRPAYRDVFVATFSQQ